MNFGNDSREPGAAERLFKNPQSLGGLVDPHRDETPGIEAEAVETGTEGNTRLARHPRLAHPEQRTAVVVRNARGERRGKPMRGADSAGLGAPNLMQRAERQPATENPVERRQAEGQQAGSLGGRPRG